MITAAVILVGRLAMITTVVSVQPKAGSMPHGIGNHTMPRYHAFTAVSQASLAALAPNS